MTTRALTRSTGLLPTMFEDFLSPWDELFETKGLWGRVMNIPAVNVSETKDNFELALAAPGMKKSDFHLDIDGNQLTISAEVEETKKHEREKFTKEEYNYSSFSRSFSLPEVVNREKIEAVYVDGVLKITLPKKEEAKKALVTKHLAVK